MGDILDEIERKESPADSEDGEGKTVADLTKSDEVVIKVDAPHWKFDKSDIMSVIRTMKLFSAISGVTEFTKSIYMERSDNKVCFKCNNRDIYFEREISLKNSELILPGNFIVTLADFETLVKTSLSSVIIFKSKKGDSLVMLGHGGEFILGIKSYPKDIYKYPAIPGNLKAGGQNKIKDVAEFRDNLRILKSLTSLAVREEDRVIVVKDGIGVGGFITTLVRAKVPFSDLSLRLMDMNFIYNVILDAVDDISFIVSEKRVFYEGTGFKLSCLRDFHDIVVDTSMFDSPTELTCMIDVEQVLGIAQTVSKVSGYSPSLEFISDAEGVWVRTGTRSGDISIFSISDKGSLGDSFKVSVETLIKVFSVFKGSMSVQLLRHDTGLCIKHNDIDIFVGVQA